MEAVSEKIRIAGIKGSELLDFVQRNVDLCRKDVKIINGVKEIGSFGSNAGFIYLNRVNDVAEINYSFRKINKCLLENGVFIGCMETLEQRKERLLKKYPPYLNKAYYALDFILKRIFPKFKFTRWITNALTGGNNRAISKAEVLGRLVYCGFRILETREIKGKLFFAVEKNGAPLTKPKPSTGLLLKIERIGFHGKPITVYKFRTMHPYAQFLQQYVYEQNSLEEGGKFSNDFRITRWGRWMRKFWIDEIPMIWNIIRGDLKIIGVRPVSEQYLSLYTPECQAVRVKGKPGLIPPFYADLPRSLFEIMESERKYTLAYLQDPLKTDARYCLKAIQNIFLKGVRSH